MQFKREKWELRQMQAMPLRLKIQMTAQRIESWYGYWDSYNIRWEDDGPPENNFETIGLLWGVYLRAAHPEYAKVMPINGITAKDAGTMLALLKVARIATGSSPDSFIDLAGYAACAGEIVTERSCPYEKAETQTQE